MPQKQRSIVVIEHDQCYLQFTNGLKSYFDLDELEKVRSYVNWGLKAGRRGNFYVAAHLQDAKIYLHRLVLEAKSGEFVDHIDGDPLNNRRSNLRIVTNSQNLHFQASKSQHGFRGVSRKKNCNKYFARFCAKYLGSFETKEEAARAYDLAAIKKYGDLAMLNFPRSFYLEVAA